MGHSSVLKSTNLPGEHGNSRQGLWKRQRHRGDGAGSEGPFQVVSSESRIHMCYLCDHNYRASVWCQMGAAVAAAHDATIVGRWEKA